MTSYQVCLSHARSRINKRWKDRGRRKRGRESAWERHWTFGFSNCVILKSSGQPPPTVVRQARGCFRVREPKRWRQGRPDRFHWIPPPTLETALQSLHYFHKVSFCTRTTVMVNFSKRVVFILGIIFFTHFPHAENSLVLLLLKDKRFFFKLKEYIIRPWTERACQLARSFRVQVSYPIKLLRELRNVYSPFFTSIHSLYILNKLSNFINFKALVERLRSLGMTYDWKLFS